MGLLCLKDSVSKVISDYAPIVVLGAGGVWILSKVGNRVLQEIQKRRMLNAWKDSPKDVVILHHLSRGKTVPGLSPFALKLETYLRMANITYQNDFDFPMGPTGKTPWITLNGEHVMDSELIINFLSKKFNKRIGNYTDQQRAIGDLARVAADEFLYWGLATWRYIFGDPKSLNDLFDMSPFAIKAFYKFVNKRVILAAHFQGIGRHSKEDIETLMKKTLRGLSLVLDNKKFFLGDEPSEVDCTLFGMIAQYLWCMPGAPYEQYINDDLPNLLEYAVRMKEHFWPDWDKCLAGAQVQIPTSS